MALTPTTNNINQVEYHSVGTQVTNYDVPFYIYSADDIEVRVNNVKQINRTHYIAEQVDYDDNRSWYITFLGQHVPWKNDIITIDRNLPIEHRLKYHTAGELIAKNINVDFEYVFEVIKIALVQVNINKSGSQIDINKLINDLKQTFISKPQTPLDPQQIWLQWDDKNKDIKLAKLDPSTIVQPQVTVEDAPAEVSHGILDGLRLTIQFNSENFGHEGGYYRKLTRQPAKTIENIIKIPKVDNLTTKFLPWETSDRDVNGKLKDGKYFIFLDDVQIDANGDFVNAKYSRQYNTEPTSRELHNKTKLGSLIVVDGAIYEAYNSRTNIDNVAIQIEEIATKWLKPKFSNTITINNDKSIDILGGILTSYNAGHDSNLMGTSPLGYLSDKVSPQSKALITFFNRRSQTVQEEKIFDQYDDGTTDLYGLPTNIPAGKVVILECRMKRNKDIACILGTEVYSNTSETMLKCFDLVKTYPPLPFDLESESAFLGLFVYEGGLTDFSDETKAKFFPYQDEYVRRSELFTLLTIMNNLLNKIQNMPTLNGSNKGQDINVNINCNDYSRCNQINESNHNNKAETYSFKFYRYLSMDMGHDEGIITTIENNEVSYKQIGRVSKSGFEMIKHDGTTVVSSESDYQKLFEKGMRYYDKSNTSLDGINKLTDIPDGKVGGSYILVNKDNNKILCTLPNVLHNTMPKTLAEAKSLLALDDSLTDNLLDIATPCKIWFYTGTNKGTIDSDTSIMFDINAEYRKGLDLEQTTDGTYIGLNHGGLTSIIGVEFTDDTLEDLGLPKIVVDNEIIQKGNQFHAFASFKVPDDDALTADKRFELKDEVFTASNIPNGEAYPKSYEVSYLMNFGVNFDLNINPFNNSLFYNIAYVVDPNDKAPTLVLYDGAKGISNPSDSSNTTYDSSLLVKDIKKLYPLNGINKYMYVFTTGTQLYVVMEYMTYSTEFFGSIEEYHTLTRNAGIYLIYKDRNRWKILSLQAASSKSKSFDLDDFFLSKQEREKLIAENGQDYKDYYDDGDGRAMDLPFEVLEFKTVAIKTAYDKVYFIQQSCTVAIANTKEDVYINCFDNADSYTANKTFKIDTNFTELEHIVESQGYLSSSTFTFTSSVTSTIYFLDKDQVIYKYTVDFTEDTMYQNETFNKLSDTFKNNIKIIKAFDDSLFIITKDDKLHVYGTNHGRFMGIGDVTDASSITEVTDLNKIISDAGTKIKKLELKINTDDLESKTKSPCAVISLENGAIYFAGLDYRNNKFRKLNLGFTGALNNTNRTITDPYPIWYENTNYAEDFNPISEIAFLKNFPQMIKPFTDAEKKTIKDNITTLFPSSYNKIIAAMSVLS
ncbi:MAG: hypothetical protein OEZ01_00160 [Candidatus Heimdallarchaeota archaeon]|nr:hypothetical protein [Candidatus Heimdallarchaeota archaeon]